METKIWLLWKRIQAAFEIWSLFQMPVAHKKEQCWRVVENAELTVKHIPAKLFKASAEGLQPRWDQVIKTSECRQGEAS